MSIILKNKPLKAIYKGLGLEEKGKVQTFLDKTTAEYLMKFQKNMEVEFKRNLFRLLQNMEVVELL